MTRIGKSTFYVNSPVSIFLKTISMVSVLVICKYFVCPTPPIAYAIVPVQVRVADWSNFSQYVKQHYLIFGTETTHFILSMFCWKTPASQKVHFCHHRKHGIECTSWKESGRGRPWDVKPPSYSARALPKWICELLQDERPLVGNRPLPFSSSLCASGHAPWSAFCCMFFLVAA